MQKKRANETECVVTDSKVGHGREITDKEICISVIWVKQGYGAAGGVVFLMRDETTGKAVLGTIEIDAYNWWFHTST